MSEGMVGGSAQHLSISDCEKLVGWPGIDDPELGPLKKHLEECENCRHLVQDYRGTTDQLAQLGAPAGARTGQSCPEEEKWLLLAVGLEDPGETLLLCEHAATCDACGRLMRMAVEDLNSETIPAEASGILSPAFAERIVGAVCTPPPASHPTPAEKNTRRNWWNSWPLWAVGAVAVIVVALVVTLKRTGTSEPGQLIAKAYESDRPWVLRFPEAGYSVYRGATRSAREHDQNPEFLRGKAAIIENLQKRPESEYWIDLMGRTDLLENKYDEAIGALRPLAQTNRPSFQILADLGTAYLAKGLANGAAADYESAIEYLSRALEQKPSDELGLFNRALAFEQSSLQDQAERDWNEYLRVDNQSGWASEAREHVTKILEKKKPGGKP